MADALSGSGLQTTNGIAVFWRQILPYLRHFDVFCRVHQFPQLKLLQNDFALALYVVII